MNVVICEDDLSFSGLLSHKLEELFAAKGFPCAITSFSSGAPLLAYFQAGNRCDLLFMDVSLPEEDGIELVKRLRQSKIQVPVIFLTSMEDRIGEGYDVSAFHYLLKKDYEAKLPDVIDRFLSEIYEKHTLCLKSGNETLLLDYDEIYYVEANRRFTDVHCRESVHSCTISIQNFSRLLPQQHFIEVYHALFVNVDHVRRVDADSLLLDNEKAVPVSRRKRKDLMTVIMRRIQDQ